MNYQKKKSARHYSTDYYPEEEKKSLCFYAVDIWLTPNISWRCEGSWEKWSAYGAPKSHEPAQNFL